MPRLLLHVCCAPDGTVPWPALAEEGYAATGFFYGSNIHPEAEWERRREAALLLAGHLGEALLVAPYAPDEWIGGTRMLAEEPEGGARCAVCFRLQLQAAAARALEIGCTHLCTTLTISPHKPPALLNDIGARVAEEAGLAWVERVWRKNGGFPLSVRRSRDWGLYRQRYCGCAYSMRRAAADL